MKVFRPLVTIVRVNSKGVSQTWRGWGRMGCREKKAYIYKKHFGPGQVNRLPGFPFGLKQTPETGSSSQSRTSVFPGANPRSACGAGVFCATAKAAAPKVQEIENAVQLRRVCGGVSAAGSQMSSV